MLVIIHNANNIRGIKDMSVNTITFQRKNIIVVDCSQQDTHLNSEQDTDFNFKIITTLKQGSEVIATCAPNTALVITIISGTRFSVAATDAIKAYANNNTPYIKSSAIL
jgi:hypothetical protein